MSAAEPFDVVVIGEALVEVSVRGGFDDASDVRLSFSGDALNAAAAAVRVGAGRVALLTRVGSDALGDAILRWCTEHGIDTTLVEPMRKPNGVYFVVADPGGTLDFAYVREGSAASTLGPDDVDIDAVRNARSLLVTGITAAISESAARAVERATELVSQGGGIVVYDPNYRRSLTTPEAAAAALAAVAPRATLVTPSCPGDSVAVLGSDDPEVAARRCRELGADAVAVTLGADGVLLDDGGEQRRLPGFAAPQVVDATGAGDVLAGVVAARLALGDTLAQAVELGTAASALSVGQQGGTGGLPRLRDIERFRRNSARGDGSWDTARGRQVRVDAGAE